MERWLRVTDNGHGEWSILDLERGYRICSFNHSTHGGVHLHHGAASRRVAITRLADALAVVRRYAAEHEAFDPDRFETVVKTWNSGPSTD